MATNLGLSIQVSEPLVQTGSYLGSFSPDAYNHTLIALGGYWDASINVSLSQSAIEEWLERGLGRHVEVFNDEDELVFEGFVNLVSANIGGLSVERGELLNIGNQASLTYGTIDTSTSPPTLGIRITTDNANNTDSQNKYGTIKKNLSTGGSTSTIAEQLRDTYLNEFGDPETKQQLNTQGGNLSLSLQVLGYIHWSKVYTYSSTTTGTQNLSAKIQAVLGAEQNGLFSTDYSGITTNTIAVPVYENDNKTGWDLLTALTTLGDSSDNRYILGMYKDRKVAYEAIPTEIEYQRRLSAGRMETITGREIKPYNILPGKWLFIPDFMIGRTLDTSSLRTDPRAIFIESVTYSAPYGLTIQGGKTDSIKQKLAKLGLAGIGA